MAERPPHPIRLDRAEAIVVFDWLAREIGERQGANLLAAFVHQAEFWALNSLFGALETMLTEPFGRDWRDVLATARKALDPEETSLAVETLGTEDEPASLAAQALSSEASMARFDGLETTIALPAAATLVLFDFLTREVDIRDGRNMVRSFVTAGEYWALANLQATLEPGEFYSAVRDFAGQLAEARTILTPSPRDTFLEILPLGVEVEST